MADVSRLKKGRGLGSPPGPDEIATSLSAPEVAPAAPASLPVASADSQDAPAAPASLPVASAESQDEGAYVRRDGRSARKTHRTLAFATRVTPDFDREVRDIADREGIRLVEVLERALEAYKAKMGY